MDDQTMAETSWFESGKEIIFEDEQDLGKMFVHHVTLAKLAALVTAALGVDSRIEIYGAVIAHLIYVYGFGQKNIDGIYSYLAGNHIARKKYRYASVPILVDAWETINQWRSGGGFKMDTYGKNVLLLIGWLLAFFKII